MFQFLQSGGLVEDLAEAAAQRLGVDRLDDQPRPRMPVATQESDAETAGPKDTLRLIAIGEGRESRVQRRGLDDGGKGVPPARPFQVGKIFLVVVGRLFRAIRPSVAAASA